MKIFQNIEDDMSPKPYPIFWLKGAFWKVPAGFALLHDLRIRYFVARYRELATAHEPIVAQKLAQESGYHSYSTFSTAFKQRMGQSVSAWMQTI